ncbi:lactate/malate dehydrogenase [Chytridium lagenaria]|nr:lactate/malate dehydrogenase [Chytridium lagenaria]
MVNDPFTRAAGGIGQPLSLLLKANPLVTELALYDIVNTPGVAADLSHINSPAAVKGFRGDDQLKSALQNADIVVIPAGVPRKPGMTRDDLFNINAGIVRNLATAAAMVCPKAFIAIISNPVNSTVPIFAEVFKKHNVFDPKRASTFVGELKKLDSQSLVIPVIGGHSGITIVPILSSLNTSFTIAERDALIQRIHMVETRFVKAKDGAGSATLSMAFAGARFTNSILQAIVLKKNVVECAFVKSDLVSGLEFFSSPVELGPTGVERILPLPKLDDYEKILVEKAIPELKANIQKGIDFVAKTPKL